MLNVHKNSEEWKHWLLHEIDENNGFHEKVKESILKVSRIYQCFLPFSHL